jgi:biotin-dependent carboxylase-like uncharacterized protein
MTKRITVLQAGWAVIQDLGRPSLDNIGIPVNGAADQYSATVANLLVGNAATDPLIEVTLSDFAFVASFPLLVSVTGASCGVFVAGRRNRQWEPLSVAAGDQVIVRNIRNGIRVYVSIHGELQADQVFGSCAPDSLLGVGRHLRAGAEVLISSDYRALEHPFSVQPLFLLSPEIPCFGSPWTIEVTDGPETGEFADSVQILYSSDYVLSPRSDHIGLRIAGPKPVRSLTGEVLSRGVPIGAVEVPPSSPELLVLQRGRPVTAGYPVVAVATRAALSPLSQVAPGDVVRFRRCSLDDAITTYRRQEQLTHALAARVWTAYSEVGYPMRNHPERTAP